MAEGYITIPKIPNNCLECHLCYITKNNAYCTAENIPNREVLRECKENIKPDFCPIKRFPSYDFCDILDDNKLAQEYQSGWNDCLEEIIKK